MNTHTSKAVKKDRVFYKCYKNAIEKEKVAIKENRETIAIQLEKFREALKDFLKKEPLPLDLSSFLSCDNRNDARTKAYAIHLDVLGVNIEIAPSLAHTVIPMPETMKRLLEVWEESHEISDDPMKYWSNSKQKFEAPNLSKLEIEAIKERNTIHLANDSEIYDYVDFVERQLDLINKSQRFSGSPFSPANFFSIHPYFEGLVTYRPIKRGLLDVYEYSLVLRQFVVRKETVSIIDDRTAYEKATFYHRRNLPPEGGRIDEATRYTE